MEENKETSPDVHVQRESPMSRGPSRFREADVKRAVRAVLGTGVEIARVEIDAAGKVILVIGKPADGGADRNEWDEAFNGKNQTQAR
jgi:hypothetical protein